MVSLYALLVFVREIHPFDFPYKGPVMLGVDAFFVVSLDESGLGVHVSYLYW